jgi:hypothetical protein
MTHRTRLKLAAAQIAANFDKPISSSTQALLKLIIAPRWIGLGVRAPGLHRWKSGELWECLGALLRRDRVALLEEIGDVGYYIAQTWDWLWWLYETIMPDHTIQSAVEKFEQRARNG